MDSPEQTAIAGVELGYRAADLLERSGDTPGAARLRCTLAVITNDASFPASGQGCDVPLFLMQMALALIDQGGIESGSGACALQTAIDHRRGARPMREGEILDPAFCGFY